MSFCLLFGMHNYYARDRGRIEDLWRKMISMLLIYTFSDA